MQSANATNSASDRAALQPEVAQLMSEIDRVATQTAVQRREPARRHVQRSAVPGRRQRRRDHHRQPIKAPGPHPRPDLRGIDHQQHDRRHRMTGAGQFVINSVDVYQGTSIARTPRRSRPRSTPLDPRRDRHGRAERGQRHGWRGHRRARRLDHRQRHQHRLRHRDRRGRDRLSAGIAAVNAISAATGVTASDGGGFMRLTAADGRNISVAYRPWCRRRLGCGGRHGRSTSPSVATPRPDGRRHRRHGPRRQHQRRPVAAPR